MEVRTIAEEFLYPAQLTEDEKANTIVNYTMFVRDLDGQEYPIQATHTWNGEINGNQHLTMTIEPTKTNEHFIHDIGKMWTVIDNEDTEYKITYLRKQGRGEKLVVEVKAIPVFFDDFDMQRIYTRYDEHMTAVEFFNLVFSGSGYDYALVDSFYALSWQGVGDGSTRLDNFKRGLDRYGAEFRISGKTVYLESQIGRDTQFQYRHKLNASNIKEEVDASAMWTYARGYGDFAEGEDQGAETNAGLKRDYTSPLASILGKRDAPPIKDGRIKDETFLLERLEELVENSLKVSVSADIHDLRKQGYAIGQPQLGDRSFLIDERIQYNQEVRIVDIAITKDWKGNVTDLKLTFGSQGLGKRHKSGLSTAAKQITDLLAGRLQLPYNVLPSTVQEVTKIINGNTNSQFKYMENGVIGHNGDDPNFMTKYVGDAIGFSKDGGATFTTAMTAQAGIVADVITSGALRTNNVSIIGLDSYFFWDNNSFTAIDPNNSSKRLDITAGLLAVKHGAISIEREDGYKIVDNGMLNLEYGVQFTSTPFLGTGIEHEGTAYTTISTVDQYIANGRYRHDGRYLKLMVGLWVETAGETATMTVTSQGDIRETYATITETSTDSSYEIVQRELTIDLGVPDGTRGSFYVNLRSQNGTKVYGYVRAGWLEG